MQNFVIKCCSYHILLYICTYLQTKIGKYMENMSFRQRVLGLEVGETITIPVSEYAYTTIRSYASDLGFATGRSYSTKRNREERTYTIIRNS